MTLISQMPTVLLGLTLAILSACSTTAQTTAPTDHPTDYRGDLSATITGTTFVGTGAASLLGPLTIQFSSPIAMDYLRITTCAREIQIQNTGNSYTYNYVASPDEAKAPCPLFAEAISKTSQTAWFFLGLKSTEDLTAHVWCNGEGWTFSGMTVCQSKASLIQSVTFTAPVTAYRAEDACHATTTDNMIFHFEPELGICRATFLRKDGNVEHWHRAVFLGYKSELLR